MNKLSFSDLGITERYVKTIVNRYKSSPSIFAWELMNEARCLGDLPGGPNCAPGTSLLSHWYKQQADFVRSLSTFFNNRNAVWGFVFISDPFHMITTGGEGHFYLKDQNVGYWFNGTFISDYNFNGQGMPLCRPQPPQIHSWQLNAQIAGEDFDANLQLENIDFVTYVSAQSLYNRFSHPKFFYND